MFRRAFQPQLPRHSAARRPFSATVRRSTTPYGIQTEKEDVHTPTSKDLLVMPRFAAARHRRAVAIAAAMNQEEQKVLQNQMANDVTSGDDSAEGTCQPSRNERSGNGESAAPTAIAAPAPIATQKAPPAEVKSPRVPSSPTLKSPRAALSLQERDSALNMTLLCQSLPLYNSFICDTRSKMWTVDEALHSRVMGFIQQMHYDDAASISKPIGAKDGKSSKASLIIPVEEALRWLAEQEYVIGTVLLVCSYLPMTPTNGTGSAVQLARSSRKEQAVPMHTNPIRYAANYVLSAFPQWGGPEEFASLWEQQVRLLTAPACALRQANFPVSSPTGDSTIKFSSDVDCGNLKRVVPVAVGRSVIYQLWIESDPYSEKRMWFRFSVLGCPEGIPLCFRLMNLSPHDKLYENGMRPSWMALPVRPTWRSVDNSTFAITATGEGQLSFFVAAPRGSSSLHFAFCAPYGYGDLLCQIARWHSTVRSSLNNIQFEERVLCKTQDGRKLHLLIITSQSQLSASEAASQDRSSPFRSPFSDFRTGKKVVLVSGRVHPGEVTGSHAVHGIISFLVSADPRAEKLRRHFIFFIVPMLNPDGVARGHTRLDQEGNNLNSLFKGCGPARNDPPTVKAMKNVFTHLQQHFGDRFFMFLDFHSHVSKEKAFAFGNALPHTAQTWNLLFPRLIASHTSRFDYGTCCFGVAEMMAKDGSSRVRFGKSLLNSYTVELTPFSSGELDVADRPQCVLRESAEVGRATLYALLDYCLLDHSEAVQFAGGFDALVREVKNDTIKSKNGRRRKQ